jgi:hypothetical protein
VIVKAARSVGIAVQWNPQGLEGRKGTEEEEAEGREDEYED